MTSAFICPMWDGHIWQSLLKIPFNRLDQEIYRRGGSFAHLFPVALWSHEGYASAVREWFDVNTLRPHHTSEMFSSLGSCITSFSDECLCRLFQRHVGLMKSMLCGRLSVPTAQSYNTVNTASIWGVERGKQFESLFWPSRKFRISCGRRFWPSFRLWKDLEGIGGIFVRCLAVLQYWSFGSLKCNVCVGGAQVTQHESIEMHITVSLRSAGWHRASIMVFLIEPTEARNKHADLFISMCNCVFWCASEVKKS